MIHRIKQVKPKDNLVIEVIFFDGTIKKYNVKKLFHLFPQMRLLEKDEKLFQSVKVDCGGYGISWNEDLDLDSEEIWLEGCVVGKIVPELNESLAHNLSTARDRSGMTQKELAENTGIYQADISKIERGIGNPSISTLQRLAEGLGMKLKVEFY